MAFVSEDGDGVVASEPEDLSAGLRGRCGRIGVETALEKGAVFFKVALGGAVDEFDGVSEGAIDEDSAAGFFEEFAVESLLWGFAGVSAAAGEADAAGGLNDADMAAGVLNHCVRAGADDVGSAGNS